METYQHVLGATDFSDLGERAITRAIGIATSTGATLTLAHVVPNDGEAHPLYPYYRVQEHLTRTAHVIASAEKVLLDRIAAELPVSRRDAHVDVRSGDPAETLIAMIRESGADLVVLATNGRRGLRRLLLGSVTERLVRESPAMHADVLVVT